MKMSSEELRRFLLGYMAERKWETPFTELVAVIEKYGQNANAVGEAVLEMLTENNKTIEDLLETNKRMAAERDEAIRQHRQILYSYRKRVESSET